MGGMPAMPEPIAPPPRVSDADTQARASETVRKEQRKRKKYGQASTVLTSPLGVPNNTAQTAAHTLSGY